MKYAIQINTAPWQSQGGDTAYQFIKAALTRGHEIVRVFFYHDGIHHAARWAPEVGRTHWRELSQSYGLDLVLCISAAQRRGVLNPAHEMPEGSAALEVAEGFRVAGLALWVDACLKADRVMVFG